MSTALDELLPCLRLWPTAQGLRRPTQGNTRGTCSDTVKVGPRGCRPRFVKLDRLTSRQVVGALKYVKSVTQGYGATSKSNMKSPVASPARAGLHCEKSGNDSPSHAPLSSGLERLPPALDEPAPSLDRGLHNADSPDQGLLNFGPLSSSGLIAHIRLLPLKRVNNPIPYFQDAI